MNPTRHLTIIYFILFVSAAALMGCATVNLGSSVPTTALAFASPDGQFTVNDCPERTSAKIDVTHSFLVNRLYYLDRALPTSIRQTAVVNAMFAESNYVSSHATRTAQALLGKQSQRALVGKPRTSLSTSDFYQFAQVISENVLRRTPSTPTDSDQSADRFWDVTKAYYKTYFDGNFYTYFGDKLSKPTVSLTISDTDIVHSAIVFLELILDEISDDPILLWQGPDGKIYPGSTQNRPSLVSIRNITTIPSIPSGPYGCGMNVHKANAVRYLANTFSKAAATESSLTIKSVGSIEIGLGIVGKVNIGDNSTLTLLIQGIVSEIVSRLTVILAVPVLEAIDYEQQPSLRAISGRTEPAVLRKMISPFVSSNVAAF